MNYFYSTKLKNNFLRKINNWSAQKLTFCTFILHFNVFSVTAGVEDLSQQWKLGSFGWVGASEPGPVTDPEASALMQPKMPAFPDLAFL